MLRKVIIILIMIITNSKINDNNKTLVVHGCLTFLQQIDVIHTPANTSEFWEQKSVQVGIQQATTKTPRDQTKDFHSQKLIDKAMSAMKLEFLDCFLFSFLSSPTKS